jgi:hypothetical protein
MHVDARLTVALSEAAWRAMHTLAQHGGGLYAERSDATTHRKVCPAQAYTSYDVLPNRQAKALLIRKHGYRGAVRQ